MKWFVAKIVFNIVFLFLSFNLFINFFVYTYYITFYVALLNISLLSKFMYVYIESVRVRAFLMKIIILISILLIHVPLQGIFFFYRINKKWMNKVIVFVLCLALILVLFLCYYSKAFFAVVLCITSVLAVVVMLYVGSDTANKLISKYKLLISVIISVALYSYNNS